MSGFNDREKGFEDKFKHDQEINFKIAARRNKLLGLWLAEQFGLAGEAAQSYAKTVVMADLDRPGDDDVVEKVLRDCQERNVELSEHRLRKQMAELQEEARRQIFSEAK